MTVPLSASVDWSALPEPPESEATCAARAAAMAHQPGCAECYRLLEAEWATGCDESVRLWSVWEVARDADYEAEARRILGRMW